MKFEKAIAFHQVTAPPFIERFLWTSGAEPHLIFLIILAGRGCDYHAIFQTEEDSLSKSQFPRQSQLCFITRIKCQQTRHSFIVFVGKSLLFMYCLCLFLGDFSPWSDASSFLFPLVSFLQSYKIDFFFFYLLKSQQNNNWGTNLSISCRFQLPVFFFLETLGDSSGSSILSG